MSGLRRAVCTVGILATALAIPVAAQAQGQRGGGMGMMGGMGGPNLINNPAVQKEIKLTDEQKEKATSFMEEYGSKMREAMGELRDLPPEERTAKMQKMNADGVKDVEKMLKPEQAKRFKEIVFQARGVDVLTDPEATKALKVTADQSDKIKNLLEAQRSEMAEARQDAGDDRQAMMAKYTSIRKATMTKAMALMTADQKAMYKEMSGEPFEVPMMGGRGGR